MKDKSKHRETVSYKHFPCITILFQPIKRLVLENESRLVQVTRCNVTDKICVKGLTLTENKIRYEPPTTLIK